MFCSIVVFLHNYVVTVADLQWIQQQWHVRPSWISLHHRWWCCWVTGMSQHVCVCSYWRRSVVQSKQSSYWCRLFWVWHVCVCSYWRRSVVQSKQSSYWCRLLCVCSYWRRSVVQSKQSSYWCRLFWVCPLTRSLTCGSTLLKRFRRSVLLSMTISMLWFLDVDFVWLVYISSVSWQTWLWQFLPAR